MHGSRRAPGVDRLLVPGELESDFERAYTTDGISLAAATINDIAKEAEKLKVDSSVLFVLRRRLLSFRRPRKKVL
ncbi:MAG: hypothetical protein JOY96_12175 [Verrucomicrobia bacterium]|nr:hypothetical protein [Verrucomicrobiota bacterium]